MDDIIVWLKTSLIGIIILGAVGSLLAGIVIYMVTRALPRAWGYGSSHINNHTELLDRIVAKRQDQLLIIYMIYHVKYTLLNVIAGLTCTIIAFYIMLTGSGNVEFSQSGIIFLSLGLFFLSAGIYHAHFIERAYNKKLIPMLAEAGHKEENDG